ncbi:MAG: zf-TFIIB domain-containing protein [Nannocystis sp.]|uniref:TFIIB-type zinc ribbon-containing protein n=1 Tax=Nannocystis sp. TaxID=1962667 RepID=UPI0024223B53|nr:zf-TFIIB domain-containing protein [Nannocystis sp.]MBK9758048.1 zf-TFIIB domain-containing protein [Nannocystis sp.]
MRRQVTPEARARVERIARALAGLLDEVPAVGAADEGARPPPGRARAPVCPRCAGEMGTVGAGQGVEIDQCLACGAIWLDVGELEALVAEHAPPPGAPPPTMAELRDRMREVNTPEGLVKYRDCPRCGQVMRRRNFGTISGVVIDECGRHGVLLDPGELQAIEAFVQLGGPALAEQFRREQERRQVPPPPREADSGSEPWVGTVASAADNLWDVLFRGS